MGTRRLLRTTVATAAAATAAVALSLGGAAPAASANAATAAPLAVPATPLAPAAADPCRPADDGGAEASTPTDCERDGAGALRPWVIGGGVFVVFVGGVVMLLIVRSRQPDPR